MNRQQVWKVVGVLVLVCGLQLYGQQTASGAQGRFTSIDVPAAGTGPSQGTFPTGINPVGAIAGYYLDANSVSHGFLRTRPHGDDEPVRVAGPQLPAGAPFTTFDAPGAGTCNPPLVPPCYPLPGTFPTGINPAGAIAGYYVDANGGTHGFLRAPKGTIATFDVPCAAPAPGNPCIPGATYTAGWNGGPPGLPASPINEAGAITGYYYDSTIGGNHGFLRKPDGTFTTFDAPGATCGTGCYSSNGTLPQAINDAGAITGIYQDITNFYLFHGFLRDPHGAFTSFDPPGSSYTQPTGINPVGAITGYSGNQGFLRSPHGAISTIDFPPHQGTFPSAINTAGMITGNYFSNNQYHGFLWRLGYSAPKTFDPPNSNYTNPFAINSAGAITGNYFVYDQNFNAVVHGFLWTPPDE
jgi:hypothetical protein